MKTSRYLVLATFDLVDRVFANPVQAANEARTFGPFKGAEAAQTYAAKLQAHGAFTRVLPLDAPLDPSSSTWRCIAPPSAPGTVRGLATTRCNGGLTVEYV
jgi:hypothetical protein